MLHPDDAQLVARDDALSGLRIVLDDEAAGALFQQHLQHLQPTSARCVYLRYKPGISCIACFNVKSSSDDCLVHVIAYRRDAHDKLSKAVNDRDSRNRIVDLELALVISVFPEDSELKALSRLFDSDDDRSILSKLVPDRKDLQTGTLATLRYKPERRYVARLDVDGKPAAVLKLHTEADYSQARRATKSLSSIDVIHVPQVLGHSDRHAAILRSWQPGVSVDCLLSTPAIARHALKEGGRLLAQLHGHTTSKLPPQTPAWEAKTLCDTAMDFHALCPNLATAMQRVAMRCATLIGKLPTLSVPIHGDFHPQQILVDDGNHTLIDFDSSALGHPASDLGNFLAHMERNYLHGLFTPSEHNELIIAFLDGYLEISRSYEQHAVGVYTVAALLRLVHEPFRTRQPDWRVRAEELITRAEKLLFHVEEDNTATDQSSRNLTQEAKSNNSTLTHDTALSFAQHATATIEVQKRILPIIQEQLGDQTLELRSASVVRHKPGRRCLIEYVCDSRQTGHETIVLGKIQAKTRHDASYRLQQMLWISGFDYESADRISVPRPLGVVYTWHMWLQERVAGQSCWEALEGSQADQVANRVAEAVYKLQHADIVTVRSHALRDELSILESKLFQVARQKPRLKSRIADILNACRELAHHIPETSPVGIHRDFYPDQVVVDGSRIFVLDHDLYCLGDPCLDIGNFCGHLIEYSLRKSGDIDFFASAQQTIIHRYSQLQGFDCQQSVDAYTTLTLARHIYLSTLFSKRRPLTTTLIEMCEARLAVCNR